ncbi:hypothetical protein LTR84_010698 [Exophiala bonariae]|uniref:Peptidase A1 domain-containing protein n=1 Tax=Exophiala bonariae TaxID=1690606 RepID=A0AAV9MVF1_9EURO|nr:hypothetical protein LTR84_010698 [Exophiala bonariae]
MYELWVPQKLARLVPALLLFICSAHVSAQNANADPWPIIYSTNNSIGPDGPWWFLSQATDFPDQILSVYPSLSQSSMIISKNTCTSQTADCPLPVQSGWTPSGAYANVNNGSLTQSPPLSPSEWNSNTATLLGQDGYAFYTQQRFTIHRNGDPNSPAFLDNLAILVSTNVTVGFPGGAKYTSDVGLFSLSGSTAKVSWANENKTTSTANQPLAVAYNDDHIPSRSFGLHIGSVEPQVEGSLVLGGYDSSRCITEPISTDGDAFSLVDISLNVSSGASAFLNSKTTEITGLFKVDGQPASPQGMLPDPGLPYLYLPKDTCDAIAAHLPVTYSSDFNLYLWDTKSVAYEQIVSSPHSLVFSFTGSDGAKGTINVPFALLNLTLTQPLASSPTAYFPCSPHEASQDVPYYLGRAFLQAAFVSYNYNTDKYFLAQAPGPDGLPKNIKRISSTDSTLASAVNPPTWDSTWASALKALESGTATGGSSPSNGTTVEAPADKGLSTGGIVGIVITVVAAAVAAVVFFVRRRKIQHKNRQNQSPPWGAPAWEQKPPPSNNLEMPTPATVQQPYDPNHAKGYYGYGQNGQQQPQHQTHFTEMPATQPVSELESDSRSRAVELGTER